MRMIALNSSKHWMKFCSSCILQGGKTQNCELMLEIDLRLYYNVAIMYCNVGIATGLPESNSVLIITIFQLLT